MHAWATARPPPLFPCCSAPHAAEMQLMWERAYRAVRCGSSVVYGSIVGTCTTLFDQSEPRDHDSRMLLLPTPWGGT